MRTLYVWILLSFAIVRAGVKKEIELVWTIIAIAVVGVLFTLDPHDAKRLFLIGTSYALVVFLLALEIVLAILLRRRRLSEH